MLGIEVSTGALVSMVTDGGGRVGLFLEVTNDLLRKAPAVHLDETGARVAGSLHWVHVASTALLTLLDCHKRRATTAIDEIAVMAKMAGVAIHDGWKPYRTSDVVHGLSNAHHVRELEAIGAAAHQSWAKDMIDLLYEARDVVEKAKAAGKDHLSRSTIRRLRRTFDTLLAAGREVNPLAVDHKRHGLDNDAHNLLHRLESYADDVLRFTTNFAVGWSDNQAERDVRLVKLQQKISGSWRTLEGARTSCAIRSDISTMNKQGHDVLDGPRQLVRGQLRSPTGVGYTYRSAPASAHAAAREQLPTRNDEEPTAVGAPAVHHHAPGTRCRRLHRQGVRCWHATATSSRVDRRSSIGYGAAGIHG